MPGVLPAIGMIQCRIFVWADKTLFLGKQPGVETKKPAPFIVKRIAVVGCLARIAPYPPYFYRLDSIIDSGGYTTPQTAFFSACLSHHVHMERGHYLVDLVCNQTRCHWGVSREQFYHVPALAGLPLG